MTDLPEPLHVKATTDVRLLAGSVVWALGRQEVVELQAIGGGAVNQAVKGLIIARGRLATTGRSLCFAPSFLTVQMEAGERTVIRLLVHQEQLG